LDVSSCQAAPGGPASHARAPGMDGLRLMRGKTRGWRGALVLFLISICSGCSSLSYYAQSIGGHLHVLQAARPIDDWLRDAATPDALKERLRKVQAMRDFAARELGLPDNASYRTYADLGRPFVVWNVTAAPALSLRLRQWCFPVAGCVDYRGYFDREAADRYARALRAEGWDVQVGGVRAYSTLGWTADPVLSTFIGLPDVEIARLIFHELSHQLLYVPGDSTFNESFATAFEEVGVRRWLQRRADPAMELAWQRYNRRKEAFLTLLRGARSRLAALYASNAGVGEMQTAKAAIFAGLRSEYAAAKQHPDNGLYQFSGYDPFFAANLNNAAIASVSTYTQMLPAFVKLLKASGDDLEKFVGAARGLASMPLAERHLRMTQLLQEPGAVVGALTPVDAPIQAR